MSLHKERGRRDGSKECAEAEKQKQRRAQSALRNMLPCKSPSRLIMRGSRLLRSLFLESPAAAHGGIAVGHDLTMVDGEDSGQREFPQLLQRSQGENMKREMLDSLCEDWEIGPSLWRPVVGSGSGS